MSLLTTLRLSNASSELSEILTLGQEYFNIENPGLQLFNSSSSSAIAISFSSQLLPRTTAKGLPPLRLTASPLVLRPKPPTRLCFVSPPAAKSSKNSKAEQAQKPQEEQEQVQEVEEDLPWIQDKVLDVVEFTGSVTQAIPGPRVGSTPLPWILAVPLAYAGVTFVIALVKTVKKFTSPRHKRKKLVSKNAELCKSVDDLLQTQVTPEALKQLSSKTGFQVEEILRKYIRYALNEKPFRKVSLLHDSQVAGVLNEISRRISRDKGPVVMDMAGYTEKGFKRKLAVQSLFGKIFYLSELPEFCSRDSSLIVKEIFGVTDEDAEKIRIHTLSEAGDIESLERMVDDSDPDDSGEGEFS